MTLKTLKWYAVNALVITYFILVTGFFISEIIW